MREVQRNDWPKKRERRGGEGPHGVKMKGVEEDGGGEGGLDQPEVPSPQTPPHSLRKRRPPVPQTDSGIGRL